MTVSKKAKQKQKQKLASGVNETASSVSHATAEQQVGFPEILPGSRNASSEVCMQTQKSGTYNSQSRHALAAFWDSIPAEKQLQLLTFDLNLLRARAYYVPGEHEQQLLQQFSYRTLLYNFADACARMPQLSDMQQLHQCLNLNGTQKQEKHL